ncbi:MAG TPA: hypothetical protein VF395_15995 [Polyangiaceae bacterium]
MRISSFLYFSSSSNFAASSARSYGFGRNVADRAATPDVPAAQRSFL